MFKAAVANQLQTFPLFTSKLRLLAVPFWIVERAREIAEK